MRNRLIHDYAGVNLDIVWQAASSELPGLVGRIKAFSDERGIDRV